MNFIERNKAIMKIADTFGDKQKLKLIEELSELTRLWMYHTIERLLKIQ